MAYMRSLKRQSSESDTTLLSSRKRSNELQTGHTLRTQQRERHTRREEKRCAYSDTERTEVLSVLLFSLAREQLGEESDRVDGQVERVDVVLGEVCRTRACEQADSCAARS